MMAVSSKLHPSKIKSHHQLKRAWLTSFLCHFLVKKEASQKHCEELQKGVKQHTVWHSIDTKFIINLLTQLKQRFSVQMTNGRRILLTINWRFKFLKSSRKIVFFSPIRFSIWGQYFASSSSAVVAKQLLGLVGSAPAVTVFTNHS